MKKKRIAIYLLFIVSFGYLFYNFIFSDNTYGMMMNHHYGYYDNYSSLTYYLRNGFVFLSFLMIVIGLILLLNKKSESTSNAMRILNQRLSLGELTVEEYRRIKETITR